MPRYDWPLHDDWHTTVLVYVNGAARKQRGEQYNETELQVHQHYPPHVFYALRGGVSAYLNDSSRRETTESLMSIRVCPGRYERL